MSEARSAMHRVFEQRERHILSETQITALSGLAASVRELIATSVLTDVEAEEVTAVSREVDALTLRLAAAGRTAPPITEMDENGRLRHLAGPVAGELNPIAPPIVIDMSDEGVARSEFVLSAVYEGYPGFVHGGVAAMILDQLAGAVAAATGRPGMTAGLDLRYRRPTPHGVPLVADARIQEIDRRKTMIRACIRGTDGRVTVEATAMFVMPIR